MLQMLLICYLHCRQQTNSKCGACCVNCATRKVPQFSFFINNTQRTTYNVQYTKYNRQYMADGRPNWTCAKPSSTKWNNLLSMKKNAGSLGTLGWSWSWSTPKIWVEVQQRLNLYYNRRLKLKYNNEQRVEVIMTPQVPLTCPHCCSLSVSGDVLLSILLTAVLYFHISSCYLLFIVFPIFAGVIKARVI